MITSHCTQSTHTNQFEKKMFKHNELWPTGNHKLWTHFRRHTDCHHRQWKFSVAIRAFFGSFFVVCLITLVIVFLVRKIVYFCLFPYFEKKAIYLLKNEVIFHFSTFFLLSHHSWKLESSVIFRIFSRILSFLVKIDWNLFKILEFSILQRCKKCSRCTIYRCKTFMMSRWSKIDKKLVKTQFNDYKTRQFLMVHWPFLA